MLTEESDHLENLRIRPSPYGDHQPRLRITPLLQRLRVHTGFDPASVASANSKGKNTAKSNKRTHEDDLQDGHRKRTRLSRDESHVVDTERVLPVYQRVLRIRYSTATDDARNNYYTDEQMADAEQNLCRWIAHYPTSEGQTAVIDLGQVSLNMGDLQVRDLEGAVILALPALRDTFSVFDYDLSYRSRENILGAFDTLKHDGRARITAHLCLVLSPEHKPNEMPFFMRLQIDCFFVCPKIFEPANPEIQEAQKRLILQLFVPPVPNSYRGVTDIPFLFSILQPAPAVSPEFLDVLQPEALVPTLLPFQRRTVGWMIGREGKKAISSGEFKSTSINERPLPLFWQQYPITSKDTLYVHRLRGVISLTRPEDNDDALGGIVAEEPGLGKTLECISTIMLNPAEGRSPINKRWDPEAKLEVKEIKTTLIVTPPSLAPQWADEFAQHAPGLKVLMYEGWQKVTVPISERDIAVEKEKREAAKLKATAAKAKKAKPRTTKARSKGKGRGKGKSRAQDDEGEVEDEALSEAQVESEEEDVVDWCAYVNTFDVCITTYNVLQHELGVARPPPSRPRRAFVQYSTAARARSPLVMCEWYRVIMDEVQMVGGGKTEQMVSLIPRLSSFAVSGTPARSHVADLIHVLKFLRIGEVADVARAWTRLQLPGYVQEFTELFRRYTVRTMKETVKAELTIPPQTRYLVPIELGRVERHYYDQTLDAALLDLGLDARGVAATENWEVDVAKLRYWLRRLRGLCTHPQVGQLAVNAVDKLHKPGVLKSMAEVLETMRNQNWRNYMEDWTEKITTMTTLAQLLQQDDRNRNRYRQALDILLDAEKEAENLIANVQETQAQYSRERDSLKADMSQQQASHSQHSSKGKSQHGNIDLEKGKGKELENSEGETAGNDTANLDLDEEGIPRNPAGEALKAKGISIQGRLRLARIALHKVKFLQGDVYHVLGMAAENEAYQTAEVLRRTLLKGTEEAAERAMTYLDHDSAVKALKEKDLYVKIPYLGKGGIKSHMLIEEGNELIEGLLNAQSALLWRWRQRLVALLTQPLGSKGDDADGQEFSRSLETQGEAEAYLQAYASLLADRRSTLTAERTLLAAHDDLREVKARKTKAARKAERLQYAALDDPDVIDQVELEQLEYQEMRPEHEVMVKTLNDERKALVNDFDPGRAIKSVLVDLNHIVVNIQNKQDPERLIAQDAVKQLKSLIAEQKKLIDRLQNDLSHLRKAFNERIAYFRQLQEISDSVNEATFETTLHEAIEELRQKQAQLDTKIKAARAHQRYMENLSQSHEEGTMDEDDKTCILCKCDFVRGYITHCAHMYCESCMKAWISRPEGKACPVCRVPINPDQLQRFSLENPNEPAAAIQGPAKFVNRNEALPRSRRKIQYNFINAQTMQDIESMDVFGSYGSKIETLVKHLLHVAVTDPGSKSIVFSAWADSLLIIQHALKFNGISCLRIDQNNGRQNAAKKFRTDPTISVLLLHGERENAGLNVTCASRVFLVESVVHHAFEVQAIARIDRMGQTRPTEVYCYYAEDSVERNILDLAAKQGLSLYTRDNAVGTLNVASLATDTDKKQVDAPSKVQKGDFIYKMDDMLAIFFPHMYEDIEYLIPEEESIQQQDDAASQTQDEASWRPTRAVHVNAVAGPSRVQ